METRLRRLIEVQPEYAHAYNALGYSLADRGLRLQEAEGLIVQALELSPEDPFILDSMGWVRFRQQDLDGALDYLQRAYAQRQDAEIAAHLGEVLWQLQRQADARKIWLEALQRHPQNDLLIETMQRLDPR
jgi:Flp pilus assembly protein TadD